MHKPKWLYEALPWIYAGGGLLVMASLHNTPGYLSGGLLIGTGLVVRLMRRRFRRETEQHVVLGVLNLPAKLRWKPALQVGDDLLDLQHRQLFTLSNELITAVARRRPDAALQSLLQQLLSLLRTHHDTEERLAAEHGHPLDAEHRQHHNALLARAVQQRERCRQGQIDMDALVRYIVVDGVGSHVASEAAAITVAMAAPVHHRDSALV